jgi:hypothetical protein
MVAWWKQMPTTVRAILLVFIASSVYAISVDHKLREYPGAFVFVFVLVWLWEAALVVGGYKWAWILFVLTSIAGLIEAPWDWHGPIPVVLSALLLALLLTPETRQYVRVSKPRAATD